MAETIFGHDRLDVYRLAMKFDGVAQSQTEYNAIDDYEHEHRCAEHEHEVKPEHLFINKNATAIDVSVLSVPTPRFAGQAKATASSANPMVDSPSLGVRLRLRTENNGLMS